MMRYLEKKRGILTPSEKARRQFERWLTLAMRQNAGLLRMPTRRVDRGGFGSVMRFPAGRFWAQRWWMDAIDRADIVGES